ncbi:MAG: 16S rRNA (uracil(1498)-N(3))-methyltransferase [Selenomonadaceae bacterium]
MRRFFLDSMMNDELKITGSDAHHIMHVLRAKIGQKLIVVDKARQVAETEITSFSAEAVTVHCLQCIKADTEASVEVILAQCLPKSDKMDYIVQKAVELGVGHIVPIMSANCVVKYDEDKREARQKKWQKVADEAAKQCGRTIQPAVCKIISLKELLQKQEMDTAVFMCYEGRANQPIVDYLQESTAKRFVVLIGPEGGFSPAEAAMCIAAGVETVTMGPRILRTETASLAALSIVLYEKGDLGGRSK